MCLYFGEKGFVGTGLGERCLARGSAQQGTTENRADLRDPAGGGPARHFEPWGLLLSLSWGLRTPFISQSC